MRERAFAVLGERVVGARMLDLFAGTGAVGLEALSRGAADVVFVDCHRTAVALVRANLEDLDVGDDRARILQRPARQAVELLARAADRFDLVWADPPFESWAEGLAVLALTTERDVVSRDATLCLECPARADLDEVPAVFDVERDLTGGASRVVILRRRSG